MIKISDAFDSDTRESVTRAQSALNRILREDAGRVDVTWEPSMDEHGAPTIRLTITDSDISRSYDFLDFEWLEGSYIRRKMRALWDSVLAERIRSLRSGAYESLVEEA